jgi:hypothetical protein
MKGYGMIQEFLAEHGLGKELFASKKQHLVDLRKDLIKRLNAAGLNNSEIGYAMGYDRSTISYWLRDDLRAHKLRRLQERRESAA